MAVIVAVAAAAGLEKPIIKKALIIINVNVFIKHKVEEIDLFLICATPL